jgi:hypothetical protein
MNRRWSATGLIVVLTGILVAACSSSSKGGGASDGGGGCGAGSSTSSGGSCVGTPGPCPAYANPYGSSPCGPDGCQLVINVTGGPDTCDGVAMSCDNFSGTACVAQGCQWTGAGGESCGSDSGDVDADEGSIEAGVLDSPMGTCVGTPKPCSSFPVDYCPTPDCFKSADAEGNPDCEGQMVPCDYWSSSSARFGEPGYCNAEDGCMWQPD